MRPSMMELLSGSLPVFSVEENFPPPNGSVRCTCSPWSRMPSSHFCTIRRPWRGSRRCSRQANRSETRREIAMKEAVIVSGARTAVGRAPRGTLRTTYPDDMAGAAIKEALRRAPGLGPEEVEDVIIGCAIPAGTQGNNIARLSAARAGLPVSVPAQTVNRFCSSGLQTIATAAERIMVGSATTIVAGGTEHMSSTLQMPLYSPNPKLLEINPAAYIPMGLTGEQVAREFKVSREQQDEFALRSNVRAKHAVDSGLFDEEIVPIDVEYGWVDQSGRVQRQRVTFKR